MKIKEYIFHGYKKTKVFKDDKNIIKYNWVMY